MPSIRKKTKNELRKAMFPRLNSCRSKCLDILQQRQKPRREKMPTQHEQAIIYTL
ncbi:hypothetical protein B4119_2639 [Parageobacillus caldoxylosilyticus]|uniref:Uncharacterized protein n=1 Tax=Saccharococcus caldoxylosilyticus TaxID=81408 RepID=A0A150LBR2_9BACL|nr:hypothetical protein B4119_2639 [Parageobacillus caldoxylosilyticus]